MSVTRTPAIAALQRMMNLPTPGSTEPETTSKILVSFDNEDLAANRNFPLTEFGVAVVDTADYQTLKPAIHSDFQYLSKVKVFHFRFKESGHLKNTASFLKAKGNYNRATDYNYGQSAWVTRDQIPSIVGSIFGVSSSTNKTTKREVVSIHQGPDDLDNLGNFAEPKCDLSSLINVVQRIPLQATAQAALPGLPLVKLGNIAQCLQFPEHSLHNAGNDALVQLTCTLLMALKEYRQRKPPAPHLVSSPEQLVKQLRKFTKAYKHKEIYGPTLYCTRCDQDGHSHTKCVDLLQTECRRCLRRNDHLTNRCETISDSILVKRRGDNYAQNKKIDMRKGAAIAPFVPLSETDLSLKDNILEEETPRNQRPVTLMTETL